MPPAVRELDLIVSVANRHVPLPILVTGTKTVLIGGLPAATIGDACGADVIVTGSATVLVGGRPAVRISDRTRDGGSVVTSWPTVLIGG